MARITSNTYETIPVITINDELVDKDRKPTMIMTMFFTIVTKAIKELFKVKIDDAPDDGKLYARKGGQWVEI